MVADQDWLVVLSSRPCILAVSTCRFCPFIPLHLIISAAHTQQFCHLLLWMSGTISWFQHLTPQPTTLDLLTYNSRHLDLQVLTSWYLQLSTFHPRISCYFIPCSSWSHHIVMVTKQDHLMVSSSSLDLQLLTYNFWPLNPQLSTFHALVPHFSCPCPHIRNSSWSHNIAAEFSTLHPQFYKLYFILHDGRYSKRVRVWSRSGER